MIAHISSRSGFQKFSGEVQTSPAFATLRMYSNDWQSPCDQACAGSANTSFAAVSPPLPLWWTRCKQVPSNSSVFGGWGIGGEDATGRPCSNLGRCRWSGRQRAAAAASPTCTRSRERLAVWRGQRLSPDSEGACLEVGDLRSPTPSRCSKSSPIRLPSKRTPNGTLPCVLDFKHYR